MERIYFKSAQSYPGRVKSIVLTKARAGVEEKVCRIDKFSVSPAQKGKENHWDIEVEDITCPGDAEHRSRYIVYRDKKEVFRGIAYPWITPEGWAKALPRLEEGDIETARRWLEIYPTPDNLSARD